MMEVLFANTGPQNHLEMQSASMHDPLKIGFPKNISLKSFQDGRGELLGKINELLALADRDNRFVHFQVVSDVPRPVEALVMAPQQPYTLPTTERIIIFKPNQRASIFSTIFGGLGRKNSSSAGEEHKDDSSNAEADASAMEPSSLPPSAPVYSNGAVLNS